MGVGFKRALPPAPPGAIEARLEITLPDDYKAYEATLAPAAR